MRKHIFESVLTAAFCLLHVGHPLTIVWTASTSSNIQPTSQVERPKPIDTAAVSLVHFFNSGETDTNWQAPTDRHLPLFLPGKNSGKSYGEPANRNKFFSGPQPAPTYAANSQSAVVKLNVGYEGIGNCQCSGVLVGSRFVLTAAHCIYSAARGGWADQIEVIPGYDRRNRPFGQASALSAMAWLGWTGKGLINWDMALIVLDEEIGESAGWLGLGCASESDFFLQNTFHNFSYPASSPFDGQVLYHRSGTFEQVEADMLYHFPGGHKGMSGGGYYSINPDGERLVFGVHSHTTLAGATAVTRITREKYLHLVREMSLWGNNHVSTTLCVQV